MRMMVVMAMTTSLVVLAVIVVVPVTVMTTMIVMMTLITNQLRQLTVQADTYAGEISGSYRNEKKKKEGKNKNNELTTQETILEEVTEGHDDIESDAGTCQIIMIPVITMAKVRNDFVVCTVD